MKTSTRRKFLSGAAALGAAAVMPTTASAGTKQQGDAKLPKLAHTVFFWLKNPESEKDREQLITGLKTLKNIDTVRAIHIGVPASTAERDVIDNSYQVSELLMFDDVEGQNAYQVHPIHQQFIEDYGHLWRKVVVYDSVAV